MLPRLQGGLGKLEMRVVRRGDNDQLDFRVFQRVFERRINFRRCAESLLDLSSVCFRIPLDDGVKCEELGECQNEGNMEGEPCQTYSDDTGLNSFRHGWWRG
jgi:hypothetical protein